MRMKAKKYLKLLESAAKPAWIELHQRQPIVLSHQVQQRLYYWREKLD